MNHYESCSYSCNNSSFQNSQRPFRLSKSADGLFRSAKPEDPTTNGDARSLRRFRDGWTATTGHTCPGVKNCWGATWTGQKVLQQMEFRCIRLV